MRFFNTIEAALSIGACAEGAFVKFLEGLWLAWLMLVSAVFYLFCWPVVIVIGFWRDLKEWRALRRQRKNHE